MRKKTDEFFMNECGKTKQKNKKLSYNIHHTQFEQTKTKTNIQKNECTMCVVYVLVNDGVMISIEWRIWIETK